MSLALSLTICISFSALLPAIGRNEYVQKLGQYMVVMKTAKHLNGDQELQRIFQHAYEHRILDITVAMYRKRFIFTLYTYDVFHPSKCRHVVIQKINTFEGGHLTRSDIFPIKLQNLHKCPIDVFVHLTEPYFNYSLDVVNGELTNFWGLEAWILRIMAKKLNFKLRLQQSRGATIGLVFENGTITGPFLAMTQGKIDVLVGYYHSRVRASRFGVSMPYLLTPLVLVIPKREKRTFEGGWLLVPFQNDVWLLLLVSLMFGLTTFLVLRYTLNNAAVAQNSWLDVVGLALGSSRNIRYHSMGTKYFVMLWTFGFVIVWGAFQGKLYGAFHIDVVPPAHTVENLVADNYTFHIRRYFRGDLIEALNIPPTQIVFTDVSETQSDFMAQLQAPHPYVIMIIWNQMCAYFRPKSFLIEPFDRIFDALQSGGLIKKWLEEVGEQIQVSVSMKNVPNTEPEPLSLTKMLIIFKGLLVLHVVSLLVFMGEIVLSKKNLNRKKVLRKIRNKIKNKIINH